MGHFWYTDKRDRGRAHDEDKLYRIQPAEKETLKGMELGKKNMVLQGNNENLSAGGTEATYNSHHHISRPQIQKQSKAQGNFSSGLLHENENTAFPQ